MAGTAECLHARFRLFAQQPGQVLPVVLQAFLKQLQKLVCGLCEVSVWRKARHDLALADSVSLALTDMAPDHLDLGFSAAGHLRLLFPESPPAQPP